MVEDKKNTSYKKAGAFLVGATALGGLLKIASHRDDVGKTGNVARTGIAESVLKAHDLAWRSIRESGITDQARIEEIMEINNPGLSEKEREFKKMEAAHARETNLKSKVKKMYFNSEEGKNFLEQLSSEPVAALHFTLDTIEKTIDPNDYSGKMRDDFNLIPVAKEALSKLPPNATWAQIDMARLPYEYSIVPEDTIELTEATPLLSRSVLSVVPSNMMEFSNRVNSQSARIKLWEDAEQKGEFSPLVKAEILSSSIHSQQQKFSQHKEQRQGEGRSIY